MPQDLPHKKIKGVGYPIPENYFPKQKTSILNQIGVENNTSLQKPKWVVAPEAIFLQTDAYFYQQKASILNKISAQDQTETKVITWDHWLINVGISAAAMLLMALSFGLFSPQNSSTNLLQAGNAAIKSFVEDELDDPHSTFHELIEEKNPRLLTTAMEEIALNEGHKSKFQHLTEEDEDLWP